MKKWAVIVVVFIGMLGCNDVVNVVPDSWTTTPYTMPVKPSLPPYNFPADNKPSVEGVFLGRMLFYDPILSADSSQSCQSCHNQANAFTDNNKALSEGITGAIGRRNSMPIFNLMWHLDGFFWDGRSDILRHQAVEPIQDPTEMNSNINDVLDKLNASDLYKEHFEKAFGIEEIDEEHIGMALEQFMNIIVSGNSKFDRVKAGLESFTASEANGEIIFNAEAIPNDPLNFGGDCFHCHGNSLFMGRGYDNNGLDSVHTDLGLGEFTGDPIDNGLFKIPTLRNLEYTGPYMHDGRFSTLEEVIDFYMFDAHKNSPNIGANMHALQDSVFLSAALRQDLVAFLLTLSDDSLTIKEEYANPF